MNNTREDMIRHVRQIGESLIKNAESIVGTEEYLSMLVIKADVRGSLGPHISIEKGFYPERFVKEE